MDKKIAKHIIYNYYKKNTPTNDDEEDFVEALLCLIDLGDKEALVQLGSYYYEKKKFELAEKYYLEAAKEGIDEAMCGLGYIYYYGRVNEPDYEKAFKYYKMSSDLGNLSSTIKISDMYKNGYYVKKDLDKSYKYLMDVYEKIKNDQDEMFWHYPEVASRLATIQFSKENINEGIELMYKARDILMSRISFTNSFWGDITIMSIIEYNLFKYDSDIVFDKCIYNLLEILKKPGIYKFYYTNICYIVESFKEENDYISVKYNDKWYKSIKDFFLYARINDNKLTNIASKLRLE